MLQLHKHGLAQNNVGSAWRQRLRGGARSYTAKPNAKKKNAIWTESRHKSVVVVCGAVEVGGPVVSLPVVVCGAVVLGVELHFSGHVPDTSLPSLKHSLQSSQV